MGHSTRPRIVSSAIHVEKAPKQTNLITVDALSAAACNPNVICVLVKNGARIAVADVTLRTPLHMAMISQSAHAVRVLLDLGADMTCGANPWYIMRLAWGVLIS